MSSVSSEVFLEEESSSISQTDDSFLEMELFDALQQEKDKDPNFDRLTEIKLAQKICKSKLLDVSVGSDLKKLYLDKLVQLGLEMDTIQEELSEGLQIERVVRVRGHSFVLQGAKGRNPCCEICLCTIWKIMQTWRKCKYCGLRSHDKCASEVRRECVWVRASKVDFALRLTICEERGLAAQNYRCVECAHPLAFDSAAELEPRLCDYTGQYFCPSCHWNDEMATPARLVHNMDCEPRPVSRAAKQLLTLVQNRPLISLSKANPLLLKLNSSLQRLHQLRQDFLYMKCYFISCRKARSLRILQYLCRHQHFVENSHLYTTAELLSLCNGTLLQEMEEVHGVFTKHILEECETCRGNGFYCEFCPQSETVCEESSRVRRILFPFSEGIDLCGNCLAVFHLKCFNPRSQQCPRCDRRDKRRENFF